MSARCCRRCSSTARSRRAAPCGSRTSWPRSPRCSRRRSSRAVRHRRRSTRPITRAVRPRPAGSSSRSRCSSRCTSASRSGSRAGSRPTRSRSHLGGSGTGRRAHRGVLGRVHRRSARRGGDHASRAPDRRARRAAACSRSLAAVALRRGTGEWRAGVDRDRAVRGRPVAAVRVDARVRQRAPPADRLGDVGVLRRRRGRRAHRAVDHRSAAVGRRHRHVPASSCWSAAWPCSPGSSCSNASSRRAPVVALRPLPADRWSCRSALKRSPTGSRPSGRGQRRARASVTRASKRRCWAGSSPAVSSGCHCTASAHARRRARAPRRCRRRRGRRRAGRRRAGRPPGGGGTSTVTGSVPITFASSEPGVERRPRCVAAAVRLAGPAVRARRPAMLGDVLVTACRRARR